MAKSETSHLVLGFLRRLSDRNPTRKAVRGILGELKVKSSTLDEALRVSGTDLETLCKMQREANRVTRGRKGAREVPTAMFPGISHG